MKYTSSLVLSAALLALAPVASAALTSIALPGTTDNDTWSSTSLTIGANSGFPGYPGNGAWPSGIGSSTGGDATLNKTANGSGGGPYPASAGIYYGGFSSTPNTNGGILAVTDTTPLSGLSTIVFQIEIGEAFAYDFYNGVLPTLSFNGGSQNLAATYTSLFSQQFTGTIQMPSGLENLYLNTYALQWDVSSLGPITSFSVSFTGVQHAQLSGLQLDQGTGVPQGSVLPAAVPEPSSLAFLAASLGLLARRRRR